MTELKISPKIFNSVYYPYLFQYNKKFEVYYGGSGSGKSVFVAQKLLIKALNKKRQVLVIRKTMASQKQSCFKLFVTLLSDWHLYDLCSINKSELTITLPNGSCFLFKGLDDPEKIKSIVGITDCWCEEATELTEEDFDQLILRLRSKIDDTQFFISFNPISKTNHCYKRWFAPDAVVGDDTFILKTTYKDNKFLPADYIKSLENMIKTNPTYYRIYALGEFCTLDRLVYTNWRKDAIADTDIKGTLICGLDFGFINDLTAFIAAIVNEAEKRIYIIKEWTCREKTNEEIAKAIINLGFGKSEIICDSAEPKSIEELRRNGLSRVKPSVKGKDSIIHGIQKVQQYEIVVDINCANVILELENYAWKKDKTTNEYLNEPMDEFNHSLDSLRYAMQCIGKGHLRTIDKKVLGI